MRSTSHSWLVTALVLGLVCVLAPSASAGLIDFNSLPRGTVIDTEYQVSDGVTFSAVNTGGGPHKLTLFDTNYDPSNRDPDLRYPWNGGNLNRDGLPAGQSQDVDLEKILIIAENGYDFCPADGLIDQPDDEAGGGIITIAFDRDIAAFRLAEVDHDECTSHSHLKFYDDGSFIYGISIGSLSALDPTIAFGNRYANQLPWITSADTGGNFDEVRIVVAGSRGYDNIEWRETGSPIPEPASTALLALGGLGLARRKRR